MDRMKTLSMYAIWIILFFFFSIVVSNVLLKNTYNDITKAGGINIAESEDGLKVETIEANSNKMQGFYRGKVTNTSDKTIESKFVRVKSYDANGSLLQTKYVKLEDLKPGESREFNARFDVGGIDHYDVDYVDEMPDDKTYMDKMFDKVKGFLRAENKLDFMNNNVWGKWGINVDTELPTWVWWISGAIVLYNLPAGFLFF